MYSKLISICIVIFFSVTYTFGELSYSKEKPLIDTPRGVEYSFKGVIGERIDTTLNNWWLTVPRSNPGLVEAYTAREYFYPGGCAHATEYTGKYLIGAIQGWRLTRSPQLKTVIQKMIDSILATQEQDGYLGILKKEIRFGDYDLWGQYHLMLGLLMYHEDTSEKYVLTALTKQADLICNVYLEKESDYLNNQKPLSSVHWFDHSIIHSFCKLYEITGNERYLKMVRLIEKIWKNYENVFEAGLCGIDFYQTPWPRWETMHQLQALPELYQITGNPDYKTAFINEWKSIYNYERHNNGACTTIEWAIGTPYWTGGFETCPTVAWVNLTTDMLRLTGESKVADELEISTFNAVLGMQDPASHWWTYDTPSDGTRMAIYSMWASQHTRPGFSEITCCSANGPRGLGMLSEWAIMADTNGPIINYFGQGEFKLSLPDSQTLKITEDTNYPANGAVKIKIDADKPSTFNLRLRIPHWSLKTNVTVNGEKISNVTPGVYLNIRRQWSSDSIILELDMSPHYAIGHYPIAKKASVYTGPILLALDEHYDKISYDNTPEIDLKNITLIPKPVENSFVKPVVLYTVKSEDGKSITLCDFATAGIHGTRYKSWLPAINGTPQEFELKYPFQNAALPQGPIRFEWYGAPSVNDDTLKYDFVIAEDKDFKNIVISQSDLRQCSVFLKDGLAKNKKYFWKVTAKNEAGSIVNTGSPGTFSIADLPTNNCSRYFTWPSDYPEAVVVSSSLNGNADSNQNQLSKIQNIQPATDRFGDVNSCIRLNMENSHIQYDFQLFLGIYYSASIWISPENLSGYPVQTIVVSSAQKDEIPLKIFIEDGKLYAYVKKGMFEIKTAGVNIEPQKWTHIAVVKENYSLNLYVNGNLAATASQSMLTSSHMITNGIRLGANTDGKEQFHGRIDDFTFYQKNLRLEDIKRLFSMPRE